MVNDRRESCVIVVCITLILKDSLDVTSPANLHCPARWSVAQDDLRGQSVGLCRAATEGGVSEKSVMIEIYTRAMAAPTTVNRSRDTSALIHTTRNRLVPMLQ